MQNKNQDEKDLKEYFDQIKDDLTGYTSKRLELLKLKAYGKVSIGASFVMYSLFILILIVLILLLCLLVLGFFFSELLNSYTAGFGILVGITLLLLLIFRVAGKSIRRLFMNMVVGLIRKIEEDED